MVSRKDFVRIAIVWGVSRLIVIVVGVIFLNALPAGGQGAEYRHLDDAGPAVDMWYRWDAGFYTTIATLGYNWQQQRQPAADMVFMPLYPLMIRAVDKLDGCFFTAHLNTCATVGGWLVSSMALLAAACLLFDLAKRRWDRATAWRAVWLLMLAPNTIYLSGVYTEALFLCECLLTFWLLERDHFALAVVAAGCASLTRSVGVALYPALVIYALRGVISPSRLHGEGENHAATTGWRLAAAHLPLLIFGGYILGIGFVVGDPLAYFKVYNTAWGRTAQSVPAMVASYFSGQPVVLWGLALSWIDLAAALFYLVLAVMVARQHRDWGLFALLALLIPIASGSLISMPRFGAVIFPFYLVMARWAGRRWQQVVVYGISLGLALLFMGRFVTWNWIA